MDHKEQIELYLSGRAGAKTERRIENALLGDAGFLQSFIKTAEQRLSMAPADFAVSVMRLLPAAPAAVIPALSGKLRAGVCFCSAAAIMLLTLSGLDRQIIEFVSLQSGKISEWIDLFKNLP
jgi:hypothetical protein